MTRKGWTTLAIALVAAVLVGLLWSGRFGGARQGPPEGMGGMPAPLVVTAEASTQAVPVTVRSVGTVEAAERITVTAQATGKIERVHFSEGQHVGAGALLVTLDSKRQQAALDVAEAEYGEVRRQLRRLRGLEAGVAVSPAQLDQLEAQVASARARIADARAALAERRITAPFAGALGLREVSPGALIQPGTPITTLSTMDALKVRYALPSELLPQLRPGLPVSIRTPLLGDSRRGKLVRIDSRVDPATRAIPLEATLAAGDPLRPGLFVTVETLLAVRRDAVVVPEQALMIEGETAFLYVIDPEGVAERRPVTVGVRRPGSAEIREGLAAGERFVVEGVQKVIPGQPVRVQGEGRPTGPPAEAR